MFVRWCSTELFVRDRVVVVCRERNGSESVEISRVDAVVRLPWGVQGCVRSSGVNRTVEVVVAVGWKQHWPASLPDTEGVKAWTHAGRVRGLRGSDWKDLCG